MAEKPVKLSKKERQRELRTDGLKKIGGVDFSAIVDRQIGDHRFERERSEKIRIQSEGVASLKTPAPAVTATFDAFTRMAAGLEGRSIADKISDPNRPTWEQYKKENEEKLDLRGGEMRKMIEYRAELDRERDRKLNQNAGAKRKDLTISDADSTNSSDSDSEDQEKKKKSKKEKSKKQKKDKKKHKKEKSKKKRRGSEEDDSDAPVKLSDFLRNNGDE